MSQGDPSSSSEAGAHSSSTGVGTSGGNNKRKRSESPIVDPSSSSSVFAADEQTTANPKVKQARFDRDDHSSRDGQQIDAEKERKKELERWLNDAKRVQKEILSLVADSSTSRGDDAHRPGKPPRSVDWSPQGLVAFADRALVPFPLDAAVQPPLQETVMHRACISLFPASTTSRQQKEKDQGHQQHPKFAHRLFPQILLPQQITTTTTVAGREANAASNPEKLRTIPSALDTLNAPSLISFSPDGSTLVAYFPPGRPNVASFAGAHASGHEDDTATEGIQFGGRLCIFTQSPNRALNDWTLSQQFVCGTADVLGDLSFSNNNTSAAFSIGNTAGLSRAASLASVLAPYSLRAASQRGAVGGLALDVLPDEPLEIRWLGIGRQFVHAPSSSENGKQGTPKLKRKAARGPAFPSRIGQQREDIHGSTTGKASEQAFLLVGNTGKVYTFHRLPSKFSGSDASHQGPGLMMNGLQAPDGTPLKSPLDTQAQIAQQQQQQQQLQAQVPQTGLFRVLEADLFSTCLAPAPASSIVASTRSSTNDTVGAPPASDLPPFGRSYMRANLPLARRKVVSASIGLVAGSGRILVATKSVRLPRKASRVPVDGMQTATGVVNGRSPASIVAAAAANAMTPGTPFAAFSQSNGMDVSTSPAATGGPATSAAAAAGGPAGINGLATLAGNALAALSPSPKATPPAGSAGTTTALGAFPSSSGMTPKPTPGSGLAASPAAVLGNATSPEALNYANAVGVAAAAAALGKSPLPAAAASSQSSPNKQAHQQETFLLGSDADPWADAILISEVCVEFSTGHEGASAVSSALASDLMTTRLLEPVWPSADVSVVKSSASSGDEADEKQVDESAKTDKYDVSCAILEDFTLLETDPSVHKGSSDICPHLSSGLQFAASFRTRPSSSESTDSKCMLRVWDIKAVKAIDMLSQAFHQFKSKSSSTSASHEKAAQESHWLLSLAQEKVLPESHNRVRFVDHAQGVITRPDQLLLVTSKGVGGESIYSIQTWDVGTVQIGNESGKQSAVHAHTGAPGSRITISSMDPGRFVALDRAGRPILQRLRTRGKDDGRDDFENLLENARRSTFGSDALSALMKQATRDGARHPVARLFLESLSALLLFDRSSNTARSLAKDLSSARKHYCTEHVWQLLTVRDWAVETMQTTCKHGMLHNHSITLEPSAESKQSNDTLSALLSHPKSSVGRRIWARLLQHVDSFDEWLTSQDACQSSAKRPQLDIGMHHHLDNPVTVLDRLAVATEVSQLRRTRWGIKPSAIAQALQKFDAGHDGKADGAPWAADSTDKAAHESTSRKLLQILADEGSACITEPIALFLTSSDMNWQQDFSSSARKVEFDAITKRKLAPGDATMRCIHCNAVSLRDVTLGKCLCGSAWWAL